MTDFMVQRRSQFIPVSDEIISYLILKATGQHSKENRRIIEGNDSEVYDVRIDDNEHVILKVHHFGDVLYRQEAWSINECHRQGVPVPQVLFVGKESINNELRDIMVLEKQNLSEHDISRVLEQAGTILKRIHSVKTHGYWRLNHDNQWNFDSWAAYMKSIIKDRTEEKQYLFDIGLTEEDFNFILKCLDLFMNNYECHQPVLCHGDYTPEHWFVDENLNITGIIDFGDMQGGPITTDFAIFKMMESQLDINSLLRGYNGINNSAIDKDFSKQLDLHTLIMLVGYLTYFIKQNNTAEIKPTLHLLKKTIEDLQKQYL